MGEQSWFNAKSKIPGQFSFPGLFIDNYNVRIYGVPSDFYLKEASYAGISILSAPLVPGSRGDSTLRIVLARDGGVIQAKTVDKDGQPIPDTSLIVMRADITSPALLADSLIRASTDQNGNYTSDRLAPPGRARHPNNLRYNPRSIPCAPRMSTSPAYIQNKFKTALDDLIAQVKKDRSILAAILCGSLSHDIVWEKSDIDLALITIDDKKVASSSLSLYAGGVNVHAMLMPRAEFRKTVEGAVRNSFMHSLLAKGRLLYTHDETIARSVRPAARDRRARHAVPASRGGDLRARRQFTRLTNGSSPAATWITPRSGFSMRRPRWRGSRSSARGLLADREVIPQAMKLNPAFFKIVYSDLLNAKKTRKNVQAALDAIDAYLAQRAATLFRPVLDHLRDVGEARSCTEIETSSSATSTSRASRPPASIWPTRA